MPPRSVNLSIAYVHPCRSLVMVGNQQFLRRHPNIVYCLRLAYYISVHYYNPHFNDNRLSTNNVSEFPNSGQSQCSRRGTGCQ